LVDSAWCAVRTRNSYFSALYHRLAARRGKKRAQLAVAHSLLVTIYYLLRDGTVYQDLGAGYFDERDRNLIQRRAVRSLERLGYRVSLEGVACWVNFSG
jgi:transposase